jgi:hypothetical protein
MTDYPKEFIEKTIQVWQPYFNESLSAEDAIEISDNMVEFIQVLSELEGKYGKKEKNI